MTLTDAPAASTTSRHTNLQTLSAREIATCIAMRKLSSAEVVAHFVARLQAVNGTLNAVTADLSESAHAAAANVDSGVAANIWQMDVTPSWRLRPRRCHSASCRSCL